MRAYGDGLSNASREVRRTITLVSAVSLADLVAARFQDLAQVVMASGDSLQMWKTDATGIRNLVGSDRVKVANNQRNLTVSWMRDRFVQYIGGVDMTIHRENRHIWPETRVVCRRSRQDVKDRTVLLDGDPD